MRRLHSFFFADALTAAARSSAAFFSSSVSSPNRSTSSSSSSAAAAWKSCNIYIILNHDSNSIKLRTKKNRTEQNLLRFLIHKCKAAPSINEKVCTIANHKIYIYMWSCAYNHRTLITFESAVGGVAIASSGIGAHPSTVTPDPSAETPLKQQYYNITEMGSHENLINWQINKTWA